MFLELSPNKTWEGFLGGFVLTHLYAFIFAPVWCAASASPSVRDVVAATRHRHARTGALDAAPNGHRYNPPFFRCSFPELNVLKRTECANDWLISTQAST